MKVDREKFFDIQAKFDNIPFTQTEEWLLSEYSDRLDDVLYFVNSLDDPQICCWGIYSKIRFLGYQLNLSGETLKKDISIRTITSFYQEIANEDYTVVNVSSINTYNVDFEIGIRRAGFIRPLGMSLCPLSILVNLQEPFNFHRNWRRNVRKSIKASVRFKHIEKPTTKDIISFIELFNQLKERKDLGFKLSEKGIAELFKNQRFRLFFVYDKDDKPIAARIVYLMNNRSYDVYAANSRQALQCCSVYLIQQKILEYLQDLKIEEFDFGRIPPGTDNMDSIYISKSYSGGIPISYNGQWIYSKKKWIDLLYTIAKFLIRGDKRY